MEHANRETPKSPEIKTVHFDTEFTPFLPTKETEKMSRGELTAYYNSLANGIPIKLEIQDGIEIPFFIKAYPCDAFRLWAITPFDPEAGYQIDKRDLTFEGRKKKLSDLMSLEKDNFVLLPKAPLLFSINPVNRGSLIKVLCEKTGGESKKNKIPQETLDLLKRIRVEASFPIGQFVSKPMSDSIWEDPLDFLSLLLTFNFFYPNDTGPLPTSVPDYNIDNRNLAGALSESGIVIHLPDDPKKLSQVRMSFFIEDRSAFKT